MGEVGASPKCSGPALVDPVPIPGEGNWGELLEYMDNLVGWPGAFPKCTFVESGSTTGEIPREELLESMDTLVGRPGGTSKGGKKATASSTLQMASVEAGLRICLQYKLVRECGKECKEVGAS